MAIDAPPSDAIAIVGVAGRFPGARSVAEFFRALCEGQDSIRHFAEHELEDAFPAEVRRADNFVAARAVLPDVDQFDPGFFGMSPREAALTDPQHRVFLECAWEALEDAGCDPRRYAGSVGVFGGCSPSTYLLRHVLHDRAQVERFTSEYQVGMYPELLGALTDTLATRVAYRLDLTGPAATLHTACSTSLFAVAQACQSLTLYQCDAALAGGVSITFPQQRGYLHQAGGIVSADGRCRPFDAQASGTVFGSGAGVVLLKRLDDARADGDQIYALIRGAGVNNDGASKAGFTAPSSHGQARAIIAAQALAGVEASSIEYIEGHGTATPLGDPIEFAGLVSAFAADGEPLALRRNWCALGSVKANIGHLDAAAGVVGLIKTALCLQRATIPPLLHFQAPNPHIDLEASPFYVPTTCRPWPLPAHGVRRAGVSSFGVGGTNVHLVLEEAPPRAPVEQTGQGPQVLRLSARSPEALCVQRNALAERLAQMPGVALADVAFTLQFGRREFEYRAACVARTCEDAAQTLRRPQRATRAQRPPLVFLFPGQGAQFAGMARELYEAIASVRDEIDRGAQLLLPLLGLDVRDALFSAPSDRTPALSATLVAQPTLFVISHALAALWERWGVKPDVMIGHSVGEFVAAVRSGALEYEAALRFVAARARALQDLPGGAMLAVKLGEDPLRARLPPGLDIAAVNAPRSCVVAGPFAAIDAFMRELEAQQVACTRLSTSHAFHSAMMDPALPALRAAAAGLTLAPAATPYVSCVTGALVPAGGVDDPDYFATHCRATVRFADALASACGDGPPPLLLEVGPGRALTTLAVQVLGRAGHAGAHASLPDAGCDALHAMLEASAALWSHGLPVQPDLQTGGARKLSLPAYPFERVTCWVDAPGLESHTMSHAPATASRLPRLRAELAAILTGVSGAEMSEAQYEQSFLELGFDSLALGQVATRIQQRLKVKVTFREMMSDHPTCAELAAHLDTLLPAEVAQPAPSQPMPAEVAPAPAPALAGSSTAQVDPGSLAGIFHAQLRAMQELVAQQNQLLAGASKAVALQPQLMAAPTLAAPAALPSADAPASGRFRPHDPGSATRGFGAPQRAFVVELTQRYAAKTGASRAATQQQRAHLADPRAVSGFRLEWKDLCYPLVCERSKGSRIWDLDGNAYVDLVNGYGQTFFGHAPDFVQAAVGAQLQAGFAIGPQSPLAGEVAAQLCRLLGMERATFCNTGSEAVMAAMRVARCVTARDKVVVFSNDYHGQFDEVLVRGTGRASAPRALPLAPGIPAESVANMLVLPYGQEQSLEYLRANIDEIAAVIVEPVQSRHPELRPFEFLRALRQLTASSGCALVFDEVVTGFRVHLGGMQNVTGIRADMATYGKVVGGGMPVGVLAGSARFMDALDGGQWRFGDDSFPEVAPTFFAGTFVRHPLVLAACKAVLDQLEAAGPSLQSELATRTTALVARINDDLARKGVPSRLEHYSSWFMANFSSADPLGALFFHHARLLGLHIQDGFPCFLTTAHSDDDLDLIARVFADSIDALQAAGILLPVGAGVPAAAAVPARVLEVAMTEPQLEILTAAQLGPDASACFNESVRIEFDGALDARALEVALKQVIERHDALRASVMPGEPRLRIAPMLEIALPSTDLREHVDPESALDAWVAHDATQPFELFAGPLLRAQLFALAPRRHVLMLTAHHIICDGWSINVIVGELAALYRARLRGAQAELAAAEAFAGYAQQQSAAHDAATERYWLQQFADLPPALELPSDRPRPAERSYAGGTYTTFIDKHLLKALRAAGAKQGCTLFTTLLGSMQLVLSRLCGQDDVVIACPFAGQGLLEDKILVGHCVHLLPLRCPIDPRASVASHLKRANRCLLDAVEHQGYTFGTLVRRLKLAPDPSRIPLTAIQFNLERIADGVAFDGMQVAVTPNPKARVHVDLFWNVVERDDGLRIDCDYNAELFDETSVERWLQSYKVLLAEVARDTSAACGSLPILCEAERRFLIDSLNQSAREYPRDARASDLFEAQARRTPDAIAVADASGDYTYAQLDRRANQFARAILSATPTPGARVAIATDRSRTMVVALLGVMKASRSYVPLDPEHPASRLQQLLQLANVSALVCDSDAIEALAPPGVATVRVDGATPHFAREHDGELPAATRGPSAAYLIFTSGSTGTPKAVEVGHPALTNCLTSLAHWPGLSSGDRFVASTTLSFDIATAELLGPLTRGGRVLVAARDEVRDGFALVRRLAAFDATHIQATPTLWRMLLAAGFRGRPGQTLWTAGEPLARDLADALLAGGAALWNLYGPTEATIFASGARVLADGRPITIGEPLANTQLYVLDADFHVCPTGVIGELFIGGEGLANGYYGREDLTRQAFIEVAVVAGAAHRLYRSGDCARRLADGSLQLLGRRDQQIKLHGFRIELEEVEHAIGLCAGVLRCAVALRQGADQNPRLVAYVVLAAGERLDAEVFRQALMNELPAYMVPTAWMQLDALPTTGNGKLDRNALPEVIAPAPTRERAVAPRTPLEAQLHAIWAVVLGADGFGVEDKLFALGADSLHVFRIIARTSEQRLPFTARDLMRNPTIAQLARQASEPPRVATTASLPAVPSLDSYRRSRGGGGRRA